MRFQIHHYHHFGGSTRETLDRLECKIDTLLKQQRLNMATWKDIEDKITAQTTLVGSVKALVEGLKLKLAEAGIPQDRIDAAFAGLAATEMGLTALTEAVVASTPAEEVVITEPGPPVV
jgi:hypothetical protein